MRRFAIAGALLLAAWSNPALAWGAAGHEAVCEIAYRELTPATKSKVDAIMATETDNRIKSFRDSCVWPDFPGAIQQRRRPEHFINVPRSWIGISLEECHEVRTCLFTGIRSDIAVLSSPSASIADKLVALKFLGHWVGDIHQPLHVSYEDDRGGNSVLVEGVAGCARDGEATLHSVWDTCIPEEIMKRLGAARLATGDDDREAFARLLRDRITPAQRSQWRASLAPLTWANESLAITRRADVGYCVKAGSVCQYSTAAEEYRADAQAPHQGKRVLKPVGDYEARFSAVVMQRIQQAGVRLAAMLERILGQ